MRIADLETPVPVVDLDILESNLDRMQAYCREHGLRLRPHVKTHKCPQIAQMQMDRGAIGITCQKLGEAEIMAEAGIRDIHLSYPIVGVGKAERLGRLANRARISVSVDSDQTLQTAEVAATMSGRQIGVWIDFDSGAGRTGVSKVEEAVRLAKLALANPNLVFGGLITYPLTPASETFYVNAESAFKADGLSIPGFSGAGTPTAATAHLTPGLTEVRHGTYAFHDRSTVGDGAATLEDCALHVWSTVVSRPTPERAILDAGSKTLSSDRVPEYAGQGFGLIREWPEAVVERLYEEHAIVRIPEGIPGPQIGDRVRILPNHVCVVVNLHDHLAAARGDEIREQLIISARGKTQ